MLDYTHSILHMSLRSPFARRVRLAFKEHHLNYLEKSIDVFAPPADFESINPLMRVPVLELRNGFKIVDSNSILLGFYDQVRNSPLKPKNPPELALALHWSGVAFGFCEGLVAYFLETQRKKDKQDDEFLEERVFTFKNCMTDFEAFIGDKTFIVGAYLTQADLDMGVALAYYGLRYDSKWTKSYPKTAAYFKTLNERTSFQETLPPPPQ